MCRIGLAPICLQAHSLSCPDSTEETRLRSTEAFKFLPTDATSVCSSRTLGLNEWSGVRPVLKGKLPPYNIVERSLRAISASQVPYGIGLAVPTKRLPPGGLDTRGQEMTQPLPRIRNAVSLPMHKCRGFTQRFGDQVSDKENR